jgi:Tfp pilus assembly protein PilV
MMRCGRIFVCLQRCERNAVALCGRSRCPSGAGDKGTVFHGRIRRSAGFARGYNPSHCWGESHGIARASHQFTAVPSGAGAGAGTRKCRRRAGCAASTLLGVRRGAILLETIVAISLFVMAAITIYAALARSAEAVERSRSSEHAADLARSAMAMIEAGLATPESLNGPLTPAKAAMGLAADEDALDGGVADTSTAAAGDAAWELEISSEPSGYDGLTLIGVRAMKRTAGSGGGFGGGSDGSDLGPGVIASFTIHQYVRLVEQAEEKAGEVDAITERARERRPRGGAR